jgi:hypothetical protein
MMNELNAKPEKNIAQAETQKLPADENETPFFPVAEGKFITLYILSFGLYGIYWFYQHWKRQKPMMDKKIYPLLRAIFSIFFTHSLFKRINQQAIHLPQQHKFNTNALATFFVTTIILSHVIEPVSMGADMIQSMTSQTFITVSLVLFLLSTYPLVKAQATINRINNDMLGLLNHKYSVWNYLIIVPGAIFWLLLVMGILAGIIGVEMQ